MNTTSKADDEFADERLEDIGIIVYWRGGLWRFKPVDWKHQIPYSPGYHTRIDAIASARDWHASYTWHVPFGPQTGSDERVDQP